MRAGDVRIVSRLITFGLPALAFYEVVPHPTVDMREQFADLFTVLQVGVLLVQMPVRQGGFRLFLCCEQL